MPSGTECDVVAGEDGAALLEIVSAGKLKETEEPLPVGMGFRQKSFSHQV